MYGIAKLLLKFLDGSDNRYIIPVYQRNYDWETKHCEQLYNDLIQIEKKERKTHFFGSIVTANAKKGGGSDYLVIDGQQRITTISLLFIAMVNLLKNKIVISKDEKLAAKIEKKFLVDEYQPEERKLRLKPIKDDCISFDKLITNDKTEFVEASHITQNYYYFYERIQKQELTIDELYDAVGRLEIIDIFLDQEDNPQLIFESLNSTGLDLTEGDKIRNFILMGLESEKQEQYYEKYWYKIEKCTEYDVSSFIRNYLTFIQRKIPNINAVYQTFKEYVLANMNIESIDDCEKILQNMLYYAEIYNKIIKATQNPKDKISSCLCRLNQIDMSVSYPFLLALFGHEKNNEVTLTDVEKSLSTIETYIFRRLICPNYQTNSLNKVFGSLDYEVMKLKSKYTEYTYSDILIYVLENKIGSSGFPKDAEFILGLKERDIYHMNKKNREYLFDRFENGDTVERVNIIQMMENQDLTIEHIMPQTLSGQWKKELGDDYEIIYEQKLHTLCNLTLTGYNSKYSNNSFNDKKYIEHGFKDSGLNLNKPLLDYECWTIKEIEDRLQKLTSQALKLWAYPKTTFVLPKKKVDAVTLADDEKLTGRTLISYSYGNVVEHETSQWVEMFIDVVSQLYAEDPSPIRILAAGKKCEILSRDVSLKEDSRWTEISTDIFLYKANSTHAKMRILNKLFDMYQINKDELVFNIKPITDE